MKNKPRVLKRPHRYAKLPPGAVLVTRPTRWGNPFRLREHGGEYTREESVRLYREYILQKIEEDPVRYDLAALRGRDLVCTCEPDQLCHADLLLELANKR